MEASLVELKSEVVKLIKLFEKEELSALSLEDQDFKVSLKKERITKVAIVPAEPQSNHIPVVSTLVGIFHIKAKGKEIPLIKIGDHVQEGQIMAFVESMRLMHEVRAPQAGTISEILVADGNAVEYGQVLLSLEV
jgi:acetyl-CoA carboxylase biotin carboxyl carrier protein